MTGLTRIAVFASGEGTNLQSLIDAVRARRIRGEIVLVVSNKPDVGALRRAERAGIETIVKAPKDFPTPEDYYAHLAHECKSRDIGLICLAGFMLQLRAPLLDAFPGRIMNTHPALLPSFGGKGMFGKHVYESVLAAGAKVTGCTIHFVDEHYDHGPIISQTAVPILSQDTPETLAARVRAQEHFAYPRAVSLFCEGRLKIEGQSVKVLPSPLDGSHRIKRALLSTADKTGLVEFAKGLEELGVEIVSTSGTAKLLRDAGVAVRSLDTITGFPEILSGRVKTLHPNVHGAILLRRRDPVQAREAELFGLEPIDLVAVNLYPFAATVAKADSPFNQDVIEQIDIGGVALIRAAAKNFEDVAVLTSPADYSGILKELDAAQGQLSGDTRKRLALAAFQHTSEYDSMISRAWHTGASPEPAAGFPQALNMTFSKIQDLRYGENPHQKAALYAPGQKSEASFSQLHGKELSYNNLLDAASTWEAACDFGEPAAVIFKHATPCGIGTGATLLEAFDRAWACDPLSAFGGVLAFNQTVGADIAEKLSKRFVEVITAPQFTPEAFQLLSQKANLRILTRQDPPGRDWQLRSIGREVLVTEPDRMTFGQDWRVVSKRAPSKVEEAALRFAWIGCKHVKSNAIVLAGPNATVGLGAGQMSRVDSVHMASVKYKVFLRDNPAPAALVMASDAFFPFRDGIDAAASVGITAVIHPGGSVKDAEIIAAADQHNLAMVFTGLRHFRH
jgi:phosphoribosylaminoimidazolecarboxamide formyltransferase / IMP cyclohydrolase